jgi:hypothetical protein
MGSGQQAFRTPAANPGGEVGARAAHDLMETTDEPLTTMLMPRLSFGPADTEGVAPAQSPGTDKRAEASQREPELLASDYLYDYVVLGFLDVLGRHGRDAS